MANTIESSFNALVGRISLIPAIQSIGRSGGRVLPHSPADGDIDVFIYCDVIPSAKKRQAVLVGMDSARVGVLSGGHWGTGDFVNLDGIETWLMYFTVAEAVAEVDAILDGRQPDKVDNYFYPTGRCAMLAGIEVLFDRASFLVKLKEGLAVYPDNLAQQLARYHLGELEDTEDLERAALRGDVLFYHFALDIAIDHFLQALYAMNRAYFPSRKRSMEYIAKFTLKPDCCENRLLEIIQQGGTAEGIGRSLTDWMQLVKDLRACQ